MEINNIAPKLNQQLNASEELNQDLLNRDQVGLNAEAIGQQASEEVQGIVNNERELTAQQFGLEAFQQSVENDPTAQIISILV